MIDPARVQGFEWDAGNARKSEDKHGVSQAEAEQVFGNEPLLVADDIAHSRHEARWQALGRTNEGRQLHVTFTMRGGGDVIRVISARPMNRKERAIHDKDA